MACAGIKDGLGRIFHTGRDASTSEPAIHGDEGTLTLQNPGEWNVGIDSVTLVPMKGERQVFPMQKEDATAAHWKNFIQCVRTREKPSAMCSSAYGSRRR